MSPSEIQAVLSLPIMGVLIWLLVREQNIHDLLLKEFLAISRQHTLDMAAILARVLPVAIDKAGEKPYTEPDN